MSSTRMSVPGPTRATQLPPQIEVVAEPDVKTIAHAVAHMHNATARMEQIMRRLEQLLALDQAPPDMHTVVLNPTGAGAAPYMVTDAAKWEAKSLGILNPSSFPITIGIGGSSVASNSRAPQCPPQAAMVLPVHVWDMEFGTSSALGAASVPFYVFRYHTLQPLMLGDMS